MDNVSSLTPFPHAHVDRFTIRQRVKAVKNVYEVRVALPGDEEGELVAYVEQKTFALKEDLRFWADEAKTAELFRIKARQRFDPRARYRVTDAEGAEIGELGKAFRRSLARSTWRIYSPDGEEIAWAAERSLFRSVLRRLLGPGRADPARRRPHRADPDPLPLRLLPRRSAGRQPRPASGFRDRYVLDVSGDDERAIDRRLAIGLAVAMDALQAR